MKKTKKQQLRKERILFGGLAWIFVIIVFIILSWLFFIAVDGIQTAQEKGALNKQICKDHFDREISYIKTVDDEHINCCFWAIFNDSNGEYHKRIVCKVMKIR